MPIIRLSMDLSGAQQLLSGIRRGRERGRERERERERERVREGEREREREGQIERGGAVPVGHQGSDITAHTAGHGRL